MTYQAVDPLKKALAMRLILGKFKTDSIVKATGFSRHTIGDWKRKYFTGEFTILPDGSQVHERRPKRTDYEIDPPVPTRKFMEDPRTVTGQLLGDPPPWRAASRHKNA